MTAPPSITAPPMPVLRAAVDLARHYRTAPQDIRDTQGALVHAVSRLTDPLAVRLGYMVLAASYLDDHHVGLWLLNVDDYARTLDRHLSQTDSHDACCFYACECVGHAPQPARERCPDCQAAPVDRLEQAVGELLAWVGRQLRDAAVTDIWAPRVAA